MPQNKSLNLKRDGKLTDCPTPPYFAIEKSDKYVLHISISHWTPQRERLLLANPFVLAGTPDYLDSRSAQQNICEEYSQNEQISDNRISAKSTRSLQ